MRYHIGNTWILGLTSFKLDLTESPHADDDDDVGEGPLVLVPSLQLAGGGAIVSSVPHCSLHDSKSS